MYPDNFAALISPFSTKTFFTEYWENKLLFLPSNSQKSFEQWFSIREFEALLTTFPFTDSEWGHIIHHGQEKAIRRYFQREKASTKILALLDKGSILQEYQVGGTIILFALQKRSPILQKLCAHLESTFEQATVKAESLLMPPHAQERHIHLQDTNRMICQIEGESLWKVMKSTNQQQTPIYEIHMKPGDFLYLLPSLTYELQTSQSLSLHLSFSFCMPKWLDLFEEIFKQIPAFRQAIPGEMLLHGLNMAELPKLEKPFSKQELEQALSNIKMNWSKMRTLNLEIGLAKAAPCKNIPKDLLLQKKKEFQCSVHTDGFQAILIFGEKSLAGPLYLEAIFRQIVEQAAFSIESLVPDLLLSNRSVLIERLVREGLLERA